MTKRVGWEASSTVLHEILGGDRGEIGEEFIKHTGHLTKKRHLRVMGKGGGKPRGKRHEKKKKNTKQKNTTQTPHTKIQGSEKFGISWQMFGAKDGREKKGVAPILVVTLATCKNRPGPGWKRMGCYGDFGGKYFCSAGGNCHIKNLLGENSGIHRKIPKEEGNSYSGGGRNLKGFPGQRTLRSGDGIGTANGWNE